MIRDRDVVCVEQEGKVIPDPTVTMSTIRRLRRLPQRPP